MPHRGRCLPDFEWSRGCKKTEAAFAPWAGYSSFLQEERKDLLYASCCSNPVSQTQKMAGDADTQESPPPWSTHTHTSAPARPLGGETPLGRQKVGRRMPRSKVQGLHGQSGTPLRCDQARVHLPRQNPQRFGGLQLALGFHVFSFFGGGREGALSFFFCEPGY
jgi:hypothetical protein